MATLTLYAPSGITSFLGSSGLSYQVTNGSITISNPLDINSALNAGFIYTNSASLKFQTLACVGDSLTSPATSFIQASSASMPAVSGLNWGLMRLNQALILPFGMDQSGNVLVNYNKAVSGTQTSDVLATQLPQALALNPGFVSIRSGINDLGLNVAPNKNTIIGNLIQACKLTIQNGATPILWTISPRTNNYGGGNGWVQTTLSGQQIINNRLMQIEINAALRLFALENKNVILIDPWWSQVDFTTSTSDLISTHTIDGLHRNNYGAFVEGYIFANAVRQYVQNYIFGDAGQTDLFDAIYNVQGNLFVNGAVSGGTLAGTAGTVGTGGVGGSTAPTNWTVNREAGTPTFTSAAQLRSDGKPGNECQINVVGSASGDILRMFNGAGSLSSNLNAGDIFYGEIAVEVVSNSGGLNGVDLSVSSQGNAWLFGGMNSDGTGIPAGNLWSGVIRSALFQWGNAGATFARCWPRVQVNNGHNATVRFSRPAFRKLNQTIPGISLY